MKTKELFLNAMALMSSVLFFALPAKSDAPLYKRGATYLESTLPPAPEAASAVKYADVPFRHCMGMAQLEIPFYTLKGKELAIPIGLSYTSGGIKLDEIAGVAGLGWDLNAGGCITRTVMDMPDEFRNGDFSHQLPNSELLEILNDPDNTDNDKFNYLQSIIYHNIDSKLDRYSYNICDLSGSFVIQDEGQVFQLSGDGVKITYSGNPMSGGITSFTITGPDGTKYHFSEKEVGTHDGTNDQLLTILDGQRDVWTATTAWYVSSITSRSGLDRAVFNYSDTLNWKRDIYSHTTSATISSAHEPHEKFTRNSSHIVQRYKTRVLTSISLHDITIEFDYNYNTGSNKHTGSEEENYPAKLTDITVRTPGNRAVRSMHLNTGRDQNDGRIVLTSLSLRGTDDNVYDTWSFSYQTREQTVSHFAQDWYGYYNGMTSGFNDIAPYHYHNSNTGLCGFPNASEAAYMSLEKYTHNGAVFGIEYEGNSYGTYPIGIRVKAIIDSDILYKLWNNKRRRSFFYEEAKIDGSYFPTMNMYTTEVTPFTFGDINGDGGYDVGLPDIGHGDGEGNGGGSQSTTYSATWTFTLHETPVTKGPSIRDTRVYYGKVTETISKPTIWPNSSGIAKTVRYYDVQLTNRYPIDVFYRFPDNAQTKYHDNPPYINSYDPYVGIQKQYVDEGPVCAPVLTRQEEYAWDESGNASLVSADNYTYDYTIGEPVLIEYAAEQVWHPFGYGNCGLQDIYHYPVYAHNNIPRQKISESHIQYYPDGSCDSVVINTSYLSRGNNLEKPSRVSSVTRMEGDRVLRMEYTYADESDASFASTLSQQHFLATPVCTEYFIVPSLSYSHSQPLEPRIGGMPNPFVPTDSLAHHNPVLPDIGILEPARFTPWKKECLNFDNLHINGNKLLPISHIEFTDGNESWREEVLSRDCKGNIQQIKEKGKPNTVILWSYDGEYPVAVIENSTVENVTAALVVPHPDGDDHWPANPIEDLTKLISPNQAQIQAVDALRTALSDAHVTTFTFDPGIGVTSITDASGIKTTFEYDSAGRLSAVKDADGNIVKDYEYNLLADDDDDVLSVLTRVYRSADASEYSADKTWWDVYGMKQQDIAFGASGNGDDLVTAYTSDIMLHDDVKTWLPYPVADTGGDFQPNAENCAATYHDNPLAYHFKRYEVSNRNKVLATALPGFEGSHENEENDSSAIFFPKYKWGLSGVITGTPYSNWQIRKTTLTDADGRSRSEFKDHAGRLIGTSIGNDAPTYYIYDDNDQLRAVAGSGISTSDTLNMWRYSYDALGRLSSKGIPGSVRESYAYDDEDRIVSITRDGVTKEMEYDDFGRVTDIYLTNDEHTDELIEYHCYDTYPGYDFCGSLVDYADGWNGPTKNLETLSAFVQINEDGDIDPSEYAITLHFYDSKARPVRHITDYSGAGILEENITYNFAGDVVNDVFIYAQGGQSDTLKISSTYDVRGRKAAGTSYLTSQRYDSASASTSYSYDDLGRPSGSTITSGSNVISSADTYTLQGWLANHSVQLNGNVQFSESLSYDTGSSPSYTGLIVRKQESQRNGAFPRVLLKDYSYDYAGRLSYESDGALASSNRRNFSYDGRGNVSSVVNFTSNFPQPPTQNYHYDGDRLVSIDDVSLGQVLSSCSFTHDNLGRMTYDGLSDLQIEYNHLDLPRKIISGGTTLVNYSYLADGTKTSSLKPTGEGIVYRGPFVYRRDEDGALTLESAACPEGRLTPGKALLYVTDHLGSVRYVIDGNTGSQLERSDYTAYGTRSGSTPSAGTGLTLRDHFTGQEDQIPDFSVPYSDHGARHYNPALLRWMVPDPLSEKYYGQSPYNYCGGNPMSFVDLDGRDWTDDEGNLIVDHSKIKVYIFFDSKSFETQSRQMFKDAEAKFGKGTVAMSNANTKKCFIQDWGDMASNCIAEVDLNYHGNNQTLMLDSKNEEYITATGNNKSNLSDTRSTNVKDLPKPIGNLENAQLNINSCKSNSRTQYPLKGDCKTLMESFFDYSNFKTVRGTSYGVSYGRLNKQPFPGHSWWKGVWDYKRR